MATTQEEAAVIAGRFLSARRAAKGLSEYPGDMPESLEEAYRIQDEAISAWPHPVLGWKVGRVVPPYASRFGTDRLAGPIFRVAEVGGADDPAMPVFANGFAAGEAEFLFRIGSAPAPGKTRFSLEETADLIDAVHVGIEIASSPLPTINIIGPIAVVSDFGNNNGLLVGPPIPEWRRSGLDDWTVATRIDGIFVGQGAASSFPDGAIGSARFLFELMAERGIQLEPGQWISTGAVTGVHEAAPGQTVEAQFGARFRLSCKLVEALPERE